MDHCITIAPIFIAFNTVVFIAMVNIHIFRSNVLTITPWTKSALN
jgi:hypothetical protein